MASTRSVRSVIIHSAAHTNGERNQVLVPAPQGGIANKDGRKPQRPKKVALEHPARAGRCHAPSCLHQHQRRGEEPAGCHAGFEFREGLDPRLYR